MKSVTWVAGALAAAALAGCVSEAKYNRLLAMNEIQAAKIKELDRQLALAAAEADSLRSQLKAAEDRAAALGPLSASKDAQLALLRKQIADQEAAIAALTKQLSEKPIVRLPADLNAALKDLAAKDPRFHYDEATGQCKFESDILFDTGDDTVKAEANDLLKKFAEIFTGVGKGFGLRIEGHTDDKPVVRPETKDKHPTNWHLSVHRAISVLRVLYQNGVDQERMCAAGYGRWRPVVANTSDENRQKNRRVEIYVVTGVPAAPGAGGSATGPTVMGGE